MKIQLPVIIPGGQAYTSTLHNQNSAAIAQLQRHVANHSRERSIAAWKRLPFADGFLAIVQTAGAQGQANYTDSRYWLKRAAPSPFSNTSQRTGQADYSADFVGTDVIEAISDPAANFGVPGWVTATNLSELDPTWTAIGRSASPMPSKGTHNLSANQIVLVDGLVDPSNPLAIWYVFSAGPATTTDKGQMQYQVKEMVAQQQPGWDFPRFHPMI